MKLNDLVSEHKLNEALTQNERIARRADYALLEKERKRISDLRDKVQEDLKANLADGIPVMNQILKSIISNLGDNLISLDKQKEKLMKGIKVK